MKWLTSITIFAIASLAAEAQTQFMKPEGIAPGTGYTHVVVTGPGKLIFISGQIARDKDGNLVGKGDLKAQAEQVFANLNAALKSAGANFNDVVKINWYIRDYSQDKLGALREVRNKYVNKENPPASTLIGVAALAQEDYLLEVEAVAALPAKPAKKK